MTPESTIIRYNVTQCFFLGALKPTNDFNKLRYCPSKIANCCMVRLKCGIWQKMKFGLEVQKCGIVRQSITLILLDNTAFFVRKCGNFFCQTIPQFFSSRKYRNYFWKNVGGMLPLETIQQRNIAVTGERVHHGPYIRW